MCPLTNSPLKGNTYKAQHDKIKRKALLAPNATGQDVSLGFGGNLNNAIGRQAHEDQHSKGRGFGSNAIDLGAVIGGMEANGVKSYLCRNYTKADYQDIIDPEDTDCEPYHRSALRTATKYCLGSTSTRSGTSTSKEKSSTIWRSPRSSFPLELYIGSL
jgi:hypothetical protein